MRFRLEGASAASGTSVGAASTVSDATEVLAVNTHTAAVLVTVANSADVTLGSFNLPSGDSTIVVKGSSDQVFAGHVGVTLSPINTRV
mgnify:FL=1|tara:strand:+ start:1492 stop:1755 length:264 start_codon:yes stop_codon:yes gene_type:complete